MNRSENPPLQSHWRKIVLPIAVALLTTLLLCSELSSQAKQAPIITTPRMMVDQVSLTTEDDCSNVNNQAPNCSFEDPDPNDGSMPDKWLPRVWGECESEPSLHWFPYVMHTGLRSVSIVSDDSNDTSCKSRWLTNRILTVTAGTRYYFSVWVQTTNFSGKALLNLVFYPDETSPNLGVYPSEIVISDTTWLEISGEAVAPPGATLAHLEARLEGSGYVWFDDVYLSEVTKAPIFQVSLDDNPNLVNAGEQLTYTLLFTNVGNKIEEHPIVTLTLDNHLTISWTEPLTSSAEDNALTWAGIFPALDQGESEKITIVVTVRSPLPDGLLLESVAEVNGQEAAPAIETEFTTVHSAPQLDLTKLAPVTITAGQRLTYAIIITNNGNITATNVDIVESYPGYFYFPDFWWSIPSLDPGATHTISISGLVSSQCPSGTVLNNTVIASSLGQPPIITTTQTICFGEKDEPVWKLELNSCWGATPWYVHPREKRDHCFELENTGNRPITNIHLTTTNSQEWPDEHFIISPTIVNQLGPGEKHPIAVTGTSPACVVSDTTNVLTLTAAGDPSTVATTTVAMTVERYLQGQIEPGTTHIVTPYQLLKFPCTITNTGNFTTLFSLIYQDLYPGDWYINWIPDQNIILGPCMTGTRVASVTYPFEHTSRLLFTDLHPLENPSLLLDYTFDHVQVARYISAEIEPGSTHSVSPQGTLTFTHRITNTGNVSTTFSLAAYITSNDSITHGWGITWNPNSIPNLGPREVCTSVASVTHPAEGGATVTITTSIVSSEDPTHTLDISVDYIQVKSHQVYLPLVLRDYPPLPTGSVVIEDGVTNTCQLTVNLTLDATFSGNEDIVTDMRIKNDDMNWNSWDSYTTTKLWTLANGPSGIRTVYVEFMGSKHGRNVTSDQIYFTLNGDFEYGNTLTGWRKIENPLPVSIVQSVPERPDGSTPPADGNYAVLLGDTNYPCQPNGVDIGYAAIEQNFRLPPNVDKLSFKYIIWSQDASTQAKYDRFEVYVNNTLEFWDGNQVYTNLDCVWRRVPGPDNPRNEQTAGWATAEIDLSAYAGQNVTISFRNYSRFDGWYNTYTYIDGVAIEGGW